MSQFEKWVKKAAARSYLSNDIDIDYTTYDAIMAASKMPENMFAWYPFENTPFEELQEYIQEEKASLESLFHHLFAALKKGLSHQHPQLKEIDLQALCELGLTK